MPGIPGIPGFGSPYVPTQQICNCNDPTTKETFVAPMCEQVGGRAMYQVFTGLDPVKQYMVRYTFH
jgi:hypothetical protein